MNMDFKVVVGIEQFSESNKILNIYKKSWNKLFKLLQSRIRNKSDF